jgi:glycerol-3-phosphate O-acyltransferase/dihydroxyacetone phosphate acyltransferase
LATKTFFREIQVIGSENIPQNAALIIYGNHNNQFIDPLLIVSKVKREVKFITAAKVYFTYHHHKSMRRAIIGHFGRALGGIPVERP